MIENVHLKHCLKLNERPSSEVSSVLHPTIYIQSYHKLMQCTLHRLNFENAHKVRCNLIKTGIFNSKFKLFSVPSVKNSCIVIVLITIGVHQALRIDVDQNHYPGLHGD